MYEVLLPICDSILPFVCVCVCVQRYSRGGSLLYLLGQYLQYSVKEDEDTCTYLSIFEI